MMMKMSTKYQIMLKNNKMKIDTSEIEKEGAELCYNEMLKKTSSIDVMAEALAIVDKNLKKEYSQRG